MVDFGEQGQQQILNDEAEVEDLDCREQNAVTVAEKSILPSMS